MDKYFVLHSFYLADNAIVHKLELYVLHNFLSKQSNHTVSLIQKYI